MQAVLEDRVVSAAQENEIAGVRTLHMSSIPDTLYMVDEQHCSSAPYAVSPVSTVDIIAGTIPGMSFERVSFYSLELQLTRYAE
jgi:hypothetical protein